MSDWKPPWMPFFIADYLADTQHLSTEQHGAYDLLLFASWNRGGSLPDDEDVLRIITKLSTKGWKAHRAVLLEFFTLQGGKLVQKRLVREMGKAVATASRRSTAGASGAARRWRGDGKDHGKRDGPAMANGMANGSQVDGNSEPTSQTSNRKYHTGVARAEACGDDRAQWAARLGSYEPGGFWMPHHWGPTPDKPGCLAPADLVEDWLAKRGLDPPKA